MCSCRGCVSPGDASLGGALPLQDLAPALNLARHQGEKRFGDAADWYRVAIECGMRQEAEYLFAWNELYRFRGQKDVFARLRSTVP